MVILQGSVNTVSVTSTRSGRRWRLVAALQVALILASLASPLAAFAAITSVTPNNINQGATATVVIDSTANNFPNGNAPYTVAFSQSGVTASVAWTNAHTLTLTVTATPSATTGLGTLTVNGSGGFASQTAPFTVNAVKQDQTITFGGLANKRPDQMPVTVSAFASSGLTVTFGSATPLVCTVSGTTVNYVANGTCTVTANQAGNATYNAAPQVSQGFAIGPAGQTITFATLVDKAVTDAAFTVSATASSGLTVTFGTATSSVCTVSGTTVDLVATGTCTIDANQAGNASWNPAPQVSRSFTVGKADTTTTVTCPVGPFTFNGTAQTPCSATVTGPGLNAALGVAYSGNTNAGTATASATFAATGTYNTSSDSKNFTIGKAASTTTVTCPAGVTYTGAAQTPCSASVTGPGGLSQALTVSYANNTNAGTATASAAFAGDANHNSSNDSKTFTINGADQTTLFITGPASKTFGDDPFIPATSGGSGGGAVTFNSSTTSVCTASGSATVTIVAAGTCTVTATKAADGNYNAATSATFDITIGKAASATVVTCPAGPFTYDGTAQTPCSASVTGPGGLNQALTVSYANNTNAGTATASASFAGDANHNSSSGSDTFTIGKAASTTTVTCPAGVTYTGAAQTPCSASVTGPGGLSQALSVSYADNTSTGTATASASFAGDANHNASSGSDTFDIGKVAQAIDFPTLPNVVFGAKSFELAATTDSGLPISYTSLSPSVCTVSGTTVTIVGVGTCVIEASQPGDATHAAATPVTQSFVVLAAGSTTPETNTLWPFATQHGSGSGFVPPLAGLFAVGVLAALIVLLGLARSRRRASADINR